MIEKSRKSLLLLALLLAFLTPFASAQQGPETSEAEKAAQVLYENALQSISEGRKEDASETLARVIEQEPQHAGAYLEVALIQCSLGRSDEAERLFAIIETRFSPPPGIIELINEARETGCNRWRATSSSSVTIARGIDHNVNQGASNPNYVIDHEGEQLELPLLPDFLPKQDQYTVLGAEYMREVSPNGNIGFIQFQGRRNDSLSQYDSAGLFTGIDSPWRFGAWATRASAMVGFVTMGGKLYQRLAQVQGSISPPLPLPSTMQFNLIGSATRTQYLSLTNFDSHTFELRGQLSYRKDGMYAATTLGYQTDNALAARPGGDRSGYNLNIMVRRSLGELLTGELNYTNQGWDSTAMYAPGLIDQMRSQKTHAVRAALQYAVAKNHTLQVEARLVRNRENISIFQYNNLQLQFSWQWHDR